MGALQSVHARSQEISGIPAERQRAFRCPAGFQPLQKVTTAIAANSATQSYGARWTPLSFSVSWGKKKMKANKVRFVFARLMIASTVTSSSRQEALLEVDLRPKAE
jgi:hypothetical protein